MVTRNISFGCGMKYRFFVNHFLALWIIPYESPTKEAIFYESSDPNGMNSSWYFICTRNIISNALKYLLLSTGRRDDVESLCSSTYLHMQRSFAFIMKLCWWLPDMHRCKYTLIAFSSKISPSNVSRVATYLQTEKLALKITNKSA